MNHPPTQPQHQQPPRPPEPTFPPPSHAPRFPAELPATTVAGDLAPPDIMPPPRPMPVPSESPSMWLRWAARLLDTVIVVPVIVVLSLLMVFIMVNSGALADGKMPIAWLIVYYGVLLAVSVAYELVGIAVWGQTLGKKIVRIKVVRITDHTPPGFGKSALRMLVPSAFLVFATLVYLTPLLDRTGFRRGWHDKAAGVVVRTG